MDFQVEVRKYGGRNHDKVGPVLTLLDDVIRTLQEMRLDIPPEYRAEAIVDICSRERAYRAKYTETRVAV